MEEASIDVVLNDPLAINIVQQFISLLNRILSTRLPPNHRIQPPSSRHPPAQSCKAFLFRRCLGDLLLQHAPFPLQEPSVRFSSTLVLNGWTTSPSTKSADSELPPWFSSLRGDLPYRDHLPPPFIPHKRTTRPPHPTTHHIHPGSSPQLLFYLRLFHAAIPQFFS